ncbi:hypothetical protein B0H13DRAFT_1934602 [Mycena leptocephala]|nr:hypothetical protein B0H13DRAFT_1934602 [Mycena leptocephala]
MRVLKGQKKLVRVAASGFHKIKGLQPPRCPHTFSDPRKSLMTLNLNKTFDDTGARANFYRAETHDCGCNVFIPDPEERRTEYVTTQEQHDYFDDDGEEDQPSSSQESSSSAREVETYLLHGDPRFPRINDLPPALSGPIQPYFCERVAIARKTVDLELIQFTEEEAGRGFYEQRPDLHPLAQTPPTLLWPFTTSVYYQDVSLEHSPISNTSTRMLEGLSASSTRPSAFLLMLGQQSCTVFVIDGYNSHVVEGCCSMAPPMNQVALKNVIPPRISVRTYPPHYIVPHQDDFIDTPSGVAFMEWNSRIGVPMDVWALLCTLMFLAEAANCAGVSLRTVLIAMRLENVRIPERQDPFCILDSQYFVNFLCETTALFCGACLILSVFFIRSGCLRLILAALTRWPYIKKINIMRFDSQFSDSLASTKELIIMTRRIGSLFITAWPLSNGIRMTPRQMISFVLSEGLHMPCFCFRTHGLPYGCEFTVLSERSRDERAYAYCHFDPPRCDFFLDLQKIYLEASYEMEYPTPLLAHFPYGQDLMTSYLTRPTEPLNIGRPIFQPQFFRGFLGDKTDQHFLEENLSVIRTLNSLSLDAGQIGPKHSVPPALPRYISTSIQTENDDPTSEFTDTEKTAIMSLANGSGIAASDFKSLLKKCGVCTKFFLARSLDAHASQCGRLDGPRKLRRN